MSRLCSLIVLLLLTKFSWQLSVQLFTADELVNIEIPPEALSLESRRSLAQEAFQKHPNLGRKPIAACQNCAVGSKKNNDSIIDEMVWYMESALVREELQNMNGKYWNLVSFWRGRGYSNEVARMILRVVAQEPKLYPNLSGLIRQAMQQPKAEGRIDANQTSKSPPLAAAAHALAQLLFEHGDTSSTDRVLQNNASREIRGNDSVGFQITDDEKEAFTLLRTSILNVPGHVERHEEIRKGFSGPQGEIAHCSGESRREGRRRWTKNVVEAPLEIVVVATNRTPELDALEKSANAFYHSDTNMNSIEESGTQKNGDIDYRPHRVTVLGLGMPWLGVGFGLKLSLLYDHLLHLEQHQWCKERLPGEAGCCLEPLVLFLDAYDVILLEPFRHIRRRFLRRGAAVLFGGEVDAAPDTSTSLLYSEIFRKLGSSERRNHRYPYLNSGSILGLAGDLKVVLEDIMQDIYTNHVMAMRAHNSISTGIGEYTWSRAHNKLDSKIFRDLFWMDIEDQRWFTRYYLRYHLVLQSESGTSLSVSQHDNFDINMDNSSKVNKSEYYWKSFVEIDSNGRIFQNTHRTRPSEYIIGATKYERNPHLPYNIINEVAVATESDYYLEAIEDGYQSDPAGSFAGAGLLWNQVTNTTPCVLHGNDWKHVVFDSLTRALRSEGWPPEPLELPLKTSRSEREEFSDRLVVRWTDRLHAKLFSWQELHNIWLPNAECASIDRECMTEHLQILVEQRLMQKELEAWNGSDVHDVAIGSTFPLLKVMTGDPVLYSSFYNDMLLRGAVMKNPSALAANAIKLLQRAIAITNGRFAAASYTLAEIIFRFGAMGTGSPSNHDLDTARLLIHRSMFLNNDQPNENILSSPSHISEGAGTSYTKSNYDLESVQNKLGNYRWCLRHACEVPPLEHKSLPRIEIVTVANVQKEELRSLSRSVQNLGMRLTVLGLGEPWPGLGQKVVKLHAFLREKLQPYEQKPHDNLNKEKLEWTSDSLVLFLDAFDILLLPTATKATLIRRFRSFKRPLLFGAESVASPDTAAALAYPPYNQNMLQFTSREIEGPLANDIKHTKERLKTPFLNSGTIMGYAGSMLCMLEEVIRDMKEQHGFRGAAITDTNDQRWFTRYWLRHTHCATLDYQGLIFRTLHGLVKDDLIVCQDGTGSVLTRDIFLQASPVVKNIFSYTNNKATCSNAHMSFVKKSNEGGGPCLLHGNGEDTLFRQISGLLAAPKAAANESFDSLVSTLDWPWGYNWREGGSRWRERDIYLSATMPSPAESMSNLNNHSDHISDLISSLRYDSTDDVEFSQLCKGLWKASDSSLWNEKLSMNLKGTVNIAVMVNNEQKQLMLKRGDNILEYTTKFVNEHNLTSGAGCEMEETSSSAAPSFSGMSCVIENLVLHFERQFFALELETMKGEYFDFISFYGGIKEPWKKRQNNVPFERFLDNMLTGGVLRDKPHLRLNATRAIRCALKRPQVTTGRDREHNFAPAIYSLANILFKIGQSVVADPDVDEKIKPDVETRLSALADAKALLNATISATLLAADRQTIGSHCTNVNNTIMNTATFHVVTVATSPRPELLLLEKSLHLFLETTLRNSGGNNTEETSDFTILGLGRKWNGLGCKLRWFAEFLRCRMHRIEFVSNETKALQSAEDLVVFIDAYDVLATGGCHSIYHIRNVFESFNASIVFGAEIQAAPDPAIELVQYPRTKNDRGSLPFLNAGCFIGKASAVELMLEDILIDLETNHIGGSVNEKFSDQVLADVDDQRWFTRYFLRHRHIPECSGGYCGHSSEISVALDTKGLLFHSLHGVPKGSLTVSDAPRGIVTSQHTQGTSPCFIHGNAGGRDELARITNELNAPGAWLSS